MIIAVFAFEFLPAPFGRPAFLTPAPLVALGVAALVVVGAMMSS